MIKSILLVLGVLVCVVIAKEQYKRYLVLKEKKAKAVLKLNSEIKEYKHAVKMARKYNTTNDLFYYEDLADKQRKLINVHMKVYENICRQINTKKFILALCACNCIFCFVYFII